jgi:hydroxymethylbilane synthase
MRIGTRRSALALAQANLIANLIGDCEIVPFVTTGDRESAAGIDPSAAGEDKSRWVAELEQALLVGDVDLAVHSAKDLPGELAQGLVLHGAPARAAPEDVIRGYGGLNALPQGARVGTSSIRRMAQLRAAREDLEVIPIHGNVDTRLRKLAEGQDDLAAIVIARAGLQRLGRESGLEGVLDPTRFVPAPGQGVLALEGRVGDEQVGEAVRAITDASAFASLLAERALAWELGASCHTPFGAWAEPGDEDSLRLRAWVGLPDGSAWASDELSGGRSEPEQLGREVAVRLRGAGAAEMLRQAEEMAGVGSL